MAKANDGNLLQHAIEAELAVRLYDRGRRAGLHVGDGFSGRICPADEAGWSHALDTQATHLGLPRTHGLAARIHRLFLPVCPR